MIKNSSNLWSVFKDMDYRVVDLMPKQIRFRPLAAGYHYEPSLIVCTRDKHIVFYQEKGSFID